MSAATPAGLRYSEDHVWARAEEAGTVAVGITDFAQSALGKIVVATLPEPGAVATADELLCEVESTKAVSEVYAPVSGTVVTVNEALRADPSSLNLDPYGAGWICTISLSDPSQLQGLRDAAAYAEFVGDDNAGAGSSD